MNTALLLPKDLMGKLKQHVSEIKWQKLHAIFYREKKILFASNATVKLPKPTALRTNT